MAGTDEWGEVVTRDSEAAGPVGADGRAFTWADCSRADFDRRLAARGHRAPASQPGLFAVATPEAERKSAARRDELPGQLDIFGGVA
jgi:hypothetical protein